MQAKITPITNTSYDSVNTTIKIIRKSTGKAIRVWNTDLDKDYTGRYGFLDTCNVSIHGGYFMEVTYRCYNGTKLIETIKGTSNTVNY